jgi:5S rRNA maturation endonuclease (ribonuclease M5)
MQLFEIDIRAELEKYSWTKPRWSSDKLICASPFRYDKSPSFFVRLEQYGDYPAGTWSDSGAYDEEWRSGNFVKLLSFLRNETYEETEEYLRGEYGWQDVSEESDVKLIPINLRIQRARQSLSAEILAIYTEDYSYMKKRGISERVQRQMGVLYNPQQKAAVIPWKLANGGLANIKYRKTYGKTFWYEKGGRPIRELVYGIERAGPTTIICEAEIDAMSWMEAGYAAVAVGGASFNNWKRDLLLRSPIEEIIIATDNDKAGGKLRNEIETAMKGQVRVRQAYVQADCKDANEALVKYGVDSLRESVEKSEGVRSLNFNVL